MTSRHAQGRVHWLMLALLVLLAAGGAAGAYWWLVLPQVTVTRVVLGPVVQAFYATGTLSPQREFPIKSKGEGDVVEVLVDKGSVVKTGDRLAFVRVEASQLRLAQAQARLDLKQRQAEDATSPALAEFDARISAAKDQLDISKRDLDRANERRDAGGASNSDVDRAAERVEGFRGAYESLRKQRSALKLELETELTVAGKEAQIAQWAVDEQTIKAPIDGVVLDRPVSVGTRVKPNDLLMQIADVRPENMVVRASVDEEDKTLLHMAQEVKLTLYAYPGRVFDGTVTRIYPQADPDRRTFEVDVTMRSPERRFSAGMTGELAFTIAKTTSALIVPTQAVSNIHEALTESQAGDEPPEAVERPCRPTPRHSPPTTHHPSPPPTPITNHPSPTTHHPSPTTPPPSTHPAAMEFLPPDLPRREGTVWVLRAGRLNKVTVPIGLRSIERVQVLSGLMIDDRVVVSAPDGLRQDQPVRAVEIDPLEAAGLNKKTQEKPMSSFN